MSTILRSGAIEPGNLPARFQVSANDREIGIPVSSFVLSAPFVAAAFLDLPARVSLGQMSGGGAVTIVLTGLAAAGLALSGPIPMRVAARCAPYGAFLIWIGLTAIWSPPGFWGVQNGILYLLFGLLLMLSGAVCSKHPDRVYQLIRRCMIWVDSVSLLFVLSNVALHGLPTDSGIWWIAPRSLALLGLIPLAWHLAGWYHGVHRALPLSCLWVAAIAISLSRTAMAISIVLVGVSCLLQLRVRGRGGKWSLAFLVISLTACGTVVMRSAVFRERFFGGDVALRVGGTAINTEGRVEIWDVVIASALEKPIVGHGIGSSQNLLRDAFADLPAVDHPHNDYLRLWHDLGVVGLGLFVLATMAWVFGLVRDWLRSERLGASGGHVQLAGAFGLVGMMFAMTTDNVIVYAFVMAPLAVLVGAGLGHRFPNAVQMAKNASPLTVRLLWEEQR